MFLTKGLTRTIFMQNNFYFGSRIDIEAKDSTAQWSLSKQRTKMIKINNQVASNILGKNAKIPNKFHFFYGKQVTQ